jgi:hypothetical protein
MQTSANPIEAAGSVDEVEMGMVNDDDEQTPVGAGHDEL